MSTKQYTPYDDINAILELLLKNVKEIVASDFIGMYLYGSLSSGDFNPESSDIDFLVVTKRILPQAVISELETMHDHIWATKLKWAGKLEGAYIHKELIRRHDPNDQPCPMINESKFLVNVIGSDWIIQRHVIREYGVILEGPDPKTLIDLVSPDDIRSAVMGTLHEWWYPMLDDPAWLRDHENGDRAFAVITMCRVLHALEQGEITSKPKAVQWARTKLNAHWNQLLDKAVAVSYHKTQDVFLEEALEFINYTKQKIEENPSLGNY